MRPLLLDIRDLQKTGLLEPFDRRKRLDLEETLWISHSDRETLAITVPLQGSELSNDFDLIDTRFWKTHYISFTYAKLKYGLRPYFVCPITGRNRRRDVVQAAELHRLGWRIATVWECSLKGRNRLGPDQVAHEIAGWLRSGATEIILREKNPD